MWHHNGTEWRVLLPLWKEEEDAICATESIARMPLKELFRNGRKTWEKGKAAVVGRWAERELVKDEKRREKKERKKEGREREKSEEKKRKKKEKESEETERKQEKGNSTDNWKDNRSVRNSITPWRRWLPKREGTHKVGRISKG